MFSLESAYDKSSKKAFALFSFSIKNSPVSTNIFFHSCAFLVLFKILSPADTNKFSASVELKSAILFNTVSSINISILLINKFYMIHTQSKPTKFIQNSQL